MRVLLTGAAGFIGSHVAKKLLQLGNVVIGVDNFSDCYDPALKRVNASQLAPNTRFQMFELDIRDQLTMRALFRSQRFDTVVHLAAMAGVRSSLQYPQLYLDVNYTGTQTLLEFSKIHKVSQFVFASTSSIYGATKAIPFVESDACTNPPQPYAISKRAAELTGLVYHQKHGMNFTALRFFTVYGPSGRPDMMPALLAESILYGRQVPVYLGPFQRDWTYVDDIADGVVAAVERPLGFEIINLGRGAPQPLSRFIETMELVSRKKANLVSASAPPTEILTTYPDISKARRLLDFDPQVSMEEGVQRYWDWYIASQNAANSPRSNTVAIPHINLQPTETPQASNGNAND